MRAGAPTTAGAARDRQLTLDGHETSVVFPLPARQSLSIAQRAIMQRIARDGSIRAGAAGRILYRYTRGYGVAGFDDLRYAASDGSKALVRLEARGLVRRDPELGWVAA